MAALVVPVVEAAFEEPQAAIAMASPSASVPTPRRRRLEECPSGELVMASESMRVVSAR